MNTRLHVGTYARNGGTGLHSLLRPETGGWASDGPISEAQNASFATCSVRHRLLYLVDEQAEGAIGVYRRADHVADCDETSLEQVAYVPTHGADPCYVALDSDESLLAVANYGDGSIAVFKLDENGIPLAGPAVRQSIGTGPVADRQDGPHAHCVCFSRDNRWLYHVDLGTDQIIAHEVGNAGGLLGKHQVAYRAPAGSGPRHLALHPILPFALLVSELSNTLTVLQIDYGKLNERQTLSTLPETYTGESLAGHLSLGMAGDRVYVTNRGHDSIAVFAWDVAGTLKLLQHVSCGGASPRAFVLLEAERQLVLANEVGGNIATFDLREDGTLSPLDSDLAVAGAAFLLVAPA